MQRIKLFWDELVKGGFFTSVSAVALIYSISLIINKPISPSFMIIVFLLSIIVYFFNFIGELKDDFKYEEEEYKRAKKSRNKIWFIIVIAVFLAFYLTLTYDNKFSFFFIFVFLTLGILYTLGLKKLTNHIVGFKDIFVAICWNMVIPFFIFFHDYNFSIQVFWIMTIVFVRDLINASYCDIKDMEVDKRSGLKTFAQVFGLPKIFNFLQAGNLISILLLTISILLGILPFFSVSLIAAFLLTAYLIDRSKRFSYFSTLTVDFEYFVWVLLILLVKHVS